MAFIFLFGSMLIVMLLRIAPPLGVKIEGDPVGKVTLGMRERVRLQRTNVYAVGAVLLIAAVAGDMPMILELVVMVGVLAILAIPVRYVLTTRGVALNRTVFREWSDFQDMQVDSSGIKLTPHTGVRAFRLVLSPDKAQPVARTLTTLMATSTTGVGGEGAPPPISTGRGSSSKTRGRHRRRGMAPAHS